MPFQNGRDVFEAIGVGHVEGAVGGVVEGGVGAVAEEEEDEGGVVAVGGVEIQGGVTVAFFCVAGE